MRAALLGVLCGLCGADVARGADAGAWLEAAGRMHPVLLHLPIGLLIGAGLLEAWSFLRRRGPSPAALSCLVLGALFGGLAAGSGWLFARDAGDGETLFWHRWAGVATPVLALVTLVLGRHALVRGARVGLYRLATLALVLLVVWTGHLGGELVWGEDFVIDALRGERDLPEGGGVASPDEASGAADGTAGQGVGAGIAEVARVDFALEVLPIFERSCVRCHGPKRRKGDLRLDGLEHVHAGEEPERVIVPGDPEGSLLYELITLPADHEAFMPKGEDPLPADEIALIRRWILEGADAPR